MLAGLTIVLLAACGGETSSAVAGPSPSASSPTGPPTQAPDNGYPLVEATQRCDSMAGLTLEKLRPKLTPPGPHAYVLTYPDGRSTPATLTFGAYGEARCNPGGFAGAVPVNTTVRLPISIAIATDDGVLVGSLDGKATFSASKLGTGQNPVIPSFSADGESSRFRGSWTPSLREEGYDGHSVRLTEAAPGDQGSTGESKAALDVSEINFMRSPYSQVGARIGIMRAKM